MCSFNDRDKELCEICKTAEQYRDGLSHTVAAGLACCDDTDVEDEAVLGDQVQDDK